MPGTATGAVARKPKALCQAMTLRDVMYAITTAITVPMVAALVHRIRVLRNATPVDDSSKNTKAILWRVRFSNETNSDGTRENAALRSAPQVRNTGLISSWKDATSARHFHLPSAI